MAKENANPQIFQVNKDRAYARRTPLEWSQLGTFCANNADDDNDAHDLVGSSLTSFVGNDTIVPTSAQDKAILQALVDCNRSTNGKGVHLLRQAGLTIPFSTTKGTASCSGPIFGLASDDSSSSNVTFSDISLLQDGVASLTTTMSHTKKRKIYVTTVEDDLTTEEVFDIIRNIQDPEHPHTLEQLGVVSLEQVELLQTEKSVGSLIEVKVRFTPTIPHCSMATLIGLCLRVKLWRSLPPSGKFKVSVQIEPGTHVSENAINKQLRDKERVCAALENKHLAGVVNKCIRNGMNSSINPLS
jgi:metal-sulfur cluster biosynthetic enzyme